MDSPFSHPDVCRFHDTRDHTSCTLAFYWHWSVGTRRSPLHRDRTLLRGQKQAGKQEHYMKSRWIEHNGRKILYQDFANLFYNWQAVRDELLAVQELVLAEPPNS